ncbi:CLUMA_CG014651, isoform A [Clunio marinus]|uniref:CLUMA_CG014651, isoform A n=1 Tax=Clunio marinus TaxID=568069 RepID=A0A1J1ILW8_9DIPT|nr:CLUMA_CG014651, isoform A [Clunio marinus]
MEMIRCEKEDRVTTQIFISYSGPRQNKLAPIKVSKHLKVLALNNTNPQFSFLNWICLKKFKT